MQIEISKLPRPEQSGDWHDKPLKWQVAGPERELQKFATKAGATLYAKIRRKSNTFMEATRAFVNTDPNIY